MLRDCKEPLIVVVANRGRISLLASYLTVLYSIGLILRYLDYDYSCHG